MEDGGKENPANVTCDSNAVIESEKIATEEEEGCHMTHLRQALDKTIKKCVSSVRYSAFKENFRPLHQHNPKALRSIKDQVGQQLESNICVSKNDNEKVLKKFWNLLLHLARLNIGSEDEMTHMFEEENIISLMNGLDSFKEYPGVAWRPVGDPPVDVRSHVLPAQEKHRDQLVAILKELESRNRMLQETVRSRQQKLFATREKIDQELSLWQKAKENVSTEAINSIKESIQSLSQS